MKTYPNSQLSVNDLLGDLNRNAEQVNIILGILKNRGVLISNLLSNFPNIYAVFNESPANLQVQALPTDIECKCPDWWFPVSKRSILRKTSANGAFHHHESCPIQIAYERDRN